MSINDYTKAEGVSQLPSDETEKQLFIIEQLHEQMQTDYARTGKKKTYHVVTFGCQMNARDSEKLVGHSGTYRLCRNRYGGCGFCHLQYLYGT